MRKISHETEKQIYKMIEKGYRASVIAEKLGLSSNTIWVYARQYQMYHKALLSNGKHYRLYGIGKDFEWNLGWQVLGNLGTLYIGDV